MGIVIQTTGRFGDADHLQQFGRAVAGGRAMEVHVQLKRFGHLPADREDGVERRHRLLEDHGDIVATDLPDFVVVQFQDVATLKDDLAGDDLARG